MNERIQQLFNKAAIVYMEEKGTATFIDTFAELIVKECVNAVNETIEQDCQVDQEKMACEFAISRILEKLEMEL